MDIITIKKSNQIKKNKLIFFSKKAELEIEMIIRIIMIGIGMIIIIFIISQIFSQDVSEGFDSFFNLF